MAVVIVVGGRRAHPVPFGAHPGAIRHIGKSSVMVVVVKTVVKLWTIFGQAGKARAIGEKNIEIAVVIVVEKGHAAGNAINHWLVGEGAVVEHKGNSRFLLPVLELD